MIKLKGNNLICAINYTEEKARNELTVSHESASRCISHKTISRPHCHVVQIDAHRVLKQAPNCISANMRNSITSITNSTKKSKTKVKIIKFQKQISVDHEL